MDEHQKLRDELIRSSLNYVQEAKGIKADRAFFDHLAGMVQALYMTGHKEMASPVPSWLWVLGIRTGNRIEEAKSMLEKNEQEKENEK